MKTCSKCKKNLPKDQFVKSPRHSEGLYPSCKDCRKAVLTKWISTHDRCSKCKRHDHAPNHRYCYDCLRKARGQKEIPKFRRRTSELYVCPRCGINPRLHYHRYCRECKNNCVVAFHARQRGKPVAPTVHKKKTARHYVNTLITRGKIERKPCEYCGDPSTEFHHFSYGPKSLDGIFVCRFHHRLHHIIEKCLLTAFAKLV